MPDTLVQTLATATQALESAGALVLLAGFVIGTVFFARAYFREGRRAAVEGYRKSIGRVTLIGLEILIAATIIKTIIIDPTVEGLGYLATMVAIRTLLGWTTVLEISGRWPWQSPRHGAGGSPDQSPKRG